VTDQLHDALARSAEQLPPSTAPVAEILHAGRARRTHRRRVRLGAAACLLAGLLLGLNAAFGTGHGSQSDWWQQSSTPAAGGSSSGMLSEVVDKGTMGSTTWSVSLVYYPTAPKGSGFGNEGVVCLESSIDGRALDPSGSCDGVSGPQDPNTDAGMYGVDQPTGLPGKIFYAQPQPEVAYATMTFTNGTPITVQKVTVPGTAFSAYVIPVAPGLHMHGLNEYNSQHQVVSHQDL
jgi:hypothetical protein